MTHTTPSLARRKPGSVGIPLPDTEVVFRAKARIVWMGDEGRVGLRFAVIDPALFEQLQHWTNKKMKDEGWDLPA